MSGFDDFFEHLTGHSRHEWQSRLALGVGCKDRLIRIPTGFGKTAGVTIAWLWNRVHREDGAWPRRLVLCLPMRTLVEQTERAVTEWLERARLETAVKVHVLMGGMSPSDWHLEPERDAVLIGTQDMLLSRALNRGYGSGRARWPMEHGLLNVDCLWVMDEIQLMGVGLATSGQLQGFASSDEREGRLPRPRKTWWMSATLQRGWLRRAPALGEVDSLPLARLESSERAGPLWTARKTLRVERLPFAADDKAERWADLVAEAHKTGDCGVTLAITNTVKSAVALHKALEQRKARSNLISAVDLRLVHSRFRGEERRKWVTEFLAREQCGPDKNRIIVATQVVEAGVDISANVLVTELAPWASLVQRFGRCARYGGNGDVVVVDRRHTDETAAEINAKDDGERDIKRRDTDRSTVMPYDMAEIEAAAEAIAALADSAGPAALEEFEVVQEGKEGRGLLPRLYPYEPLHVLTRRELHDLFDTGPDLAGADIDISRFVREGDGRDVTVWWWPIFQGQSPHRRLRPAHDALCRIPIGDARKWLVTGTTNVDGDQSAAERARDASRKSPRRAWVWSYVEGEWERLEERHVYPGQTILVDASAGGYDARIGFTGKPGEILVVAEHARATEAPDAADAADEQDELSEGIGQSDRQYKTIATHGAEVAAEAGKVANVLGLPARERNGLELAGLAHDIGKAHEAFAHAIKDRNGIALGTPLAKAPKGRWHRVRDMYDHSSLGKRPGFRHELASALALLEFAWRARPEHAALQGGHEEILDLTVGRELPDDEDRIVEARGMIPQLVALDATTLNLVLYLVMCHHGKVRATLPMSARDQDNPGRDGSLPIRGVRDGDPLPALALVDTEGRAFDLPDVRLRLDAARIGLSRRYGPSWVERVLALREHYGVFQLTWFEALLRVADVRASRIARPLDSRLPHDLAEVQRTTDNENRDVDLRKWIDETLAAGTTAPKATKRKGKTEGGTELRRMRAKHAKSN